MTETHIASSDFDYGLFMALSGGTPEGRQQLLMHLLQQLSEHVDAGLIRDSRVAIVRLTLELIEPYEDNAEDLL